MWNAVLVQWRDDFVGLLSQRFDPLCGWLSHLKFYVRCCHTPVAALYILLECKVFICVIVDNYTISFFFWYVYLLYICCFIEPLAWDEDAWISWKRHQGPASYLHKLRTIIFLRFNIVYGKPLDTYIILDLSIVYLASYHIEINQEKCPSIKNKVIVVIKSIWFY